MKKRYIKKALSLILSVFVLTTAITSFSVSAAPVMPLPSLIETEGKVGSGDIDKDGSLSLSDLEYTKKYILNMRNTTNSEIMKMDLNLDGTVNVFDYVLMKRDLINGSAREHISWRVSKILDSNTFATGDDYVFTSKSQLSDYLVGLYMGYFTNSIGCPYSALLYEYVSKYDDEFFDNNVLLIKPIFQSQCEAILYNINRVYYDGDTLNIDYTYNYDSMRPYEQVVSSLLAEVAVPKSLFHVDYPEGISWNYHEKDWKIGYGSCEPELIADETFEFTSQDGEQRFGVRQFVEAYPSSYNDVDWICLADDVPIKNTVDIKYGKYITYIEFYRYGDDSEYLDGVTIRSDTPYWPFNNNGYWEDTLMSTDDPVRPVPDIYLPLPDIFSDGKNFWIAWNDSSVEFRFLADKEYNLEFDYLDKTVKTQTIKKDINNKEKTEVVSVALTADCWGSLSYKAKLTDVFDEYIVPRTTMGLIGSPVLIEINDEVSNALAAFKYNDAELTCDENDIAVLYYDHNAANSPNDVVILPILIDGEKIDTEHNIVTVDVLESGVYFLVDRNIYDLTLKNGVEGIYEISMDDDYIVTKNMYSFGKIAWNISCGGKFAMSNADDLDLKQVFEGNSGEKCQVYLTVYNNNDSWIRVSNIIEFIVP